MARTKWQAITLKIISVLDLCIEDSRIGRLFLHDQAKWQPDHFPTFFGSSLLSHISVGSLGQLSHPQPRLHAAPAKSLTYNLFWLIKKSLKQSGYSTHQTLSYSTSIMQEVLSAVHWSDALAKSLLMSTPDEHT